MIEGVLYRLFLGILDLGASVAQRLAQAPLTSESCMVLNLCQDSSNFSCENSMPTLCRKSWVFSGHSGFSPTGKVGWWVKIKIDLVRKVISELW